MEQLTAWVLKTLLIWFILAVAFLLTFLIMKAFWRLFPGEEEKFFEAQKELADSIEQLKVSVFETYTPWVERLVEAVAKVLLFLFRR